MRGTYCNFVPLKSRLFFGHMGYSLSVEETKGEKGLDHLAAKLKGAHGAHLVSSDGIVRAGKTLGHFLRKRAM